MLSDRKKQHLDIVLSGRGQSRHRTTGLENIQFEHVALPELDLAEIDLSTVFLGKVIKSPFLVSSMTGGPQRADLINRNLAMACEDMRIPLAVGSQRIAIETGDAGGLTREIRRLAPSIPILANIGAAQLNTGFGCDEAQRAVDMIEADALIIHLNPLQEAVQPEGDRNWKGLTEAIAGVSARLPVPLVAKEVGYGISPAVADRLLDAGVRIIDISGVGGTSWSDIEAERATNAAQAAVAAAFSGWGQSTAQAISSLRQHRPDIGIIGSGGIQTGVDAAKAIRLGADIVGQAAAVLKAAIVSPEAVIDHFAVMTEQLRIACFCTGSGNLATLRTARLEGEGSATTAWPADAVAGASHRSATLS